MEFGYPVGSVAHDTATNSWRLAPDFDYATDLWQVAPVAKAEGVCVALYDPAGRVVTQGAFSADLPLFLEGPETAIRLDRVEIDGELVLLVPSAPLEPGHRYGVSYPDWQAGASATPEEIATLPALGGGTLIATNEGEIPIDWLRPGDKVLTRDNGYQPLLWLGQHIVPKRAPHELRPLTLGRDQFGKDQPAHQLVITPGCPVLLAGAELDLWFGESEMFAHASDLIGEPPRAPGRQAVYTLLFDAPEVVLAGGLWVGTVHADAAYLSLLPTGMRAVVAPYLLGLHQQPARACLAQWEVEMFTRESTRKKGTVTA
ncbi:Hint domain-containing protein [Thioclava sp.]|uniref:Hint domain-containing protein n=1 Tax=Thioclava sp. TaxID=1933450 RepID=UPI003AA9CB9B